MRSRIIAAIITVVTALNVHARYGYHNDLHKHPWAAVPINVSLPSNLTVKEIIDLDHDLANVARTNFQARQDIRERARGNPIVRLTSKLYRASTGTAEPTFQTLVEKYYPRYEGNTAKVLCKIADAKRSNIYADMGAWILVFICIVSGSFTCI